MIVKLQGVVQDLIWHFRHKNLDTIGHWLSETSRIFFYHRIEYFVLTRSLKEPLPSLKARLPIAYHVAEPDDLSCLKDTILPSKLAYFRNRLAHGRICILGFHQNNVAAYGWTTDEVVFNIDNLQLRLGPGDAYVDDIYTLPTYRRQGIGGELHLRCLQYLKERGFKRSVLIVRMDNVPALKIDKKLGYKESDRLSFRRKFFKREYRYHNDRF